MEVWSDGCRLKNHVVVLASDVHLLWKNSTSEIALINPLGPRTTKVVNASRVLRGLAPLLTLLSPPRTWPKLRHFRSAFF